MVHFFFFNDTATTEIYTLSLHDALPISARVPEDRAQQSHARDRRLRARGQGRGGERSEEHTSELQSRQYLVCRLLLEKKKKKTVSRKAFSMWSNYGGRFSDVLFWILYPA